jgi:hypothetical protein
MRKLHNANCLYVIKYIRILIKVLIGIMWVCTMGFGLEEVFCSLCLEGPTQIVIFSQDIPFACQDSNRASRWIRLFLVPYMEWDCVLLERPPLFGLLYQLRMMTMDDDDCGTVGGMIDRGNRSIRRKHAPVALYPPQISHDLTWARTRAVAVESRRLTTWAKERPKDQAYSFSLSVCMREMRKESHYVLPLFQPGLQALVRLKTQCLKIDRICTILMKPEKNLQTNWIF